MNTKDSLNNESNNSEICSFNNPLEEYDMFMERLKILVGEFFMMCEKGRTIRYQGLKARHKSMELRNVLKDFRRVSLKNEKYITELYKKLKDSL